MDVVTAFPNPEVDDPDLYMATPKGQWQRQRKQLGGLCRLYSQTAESFVRTKASNRYQQYQSRTNPDIGGLTAEMGNLGYGQTNLDPAFV